MDFKITSDEKFAPNSYEVIIMDPGLDINDVVKNIKRESATTPEDTDNVIRELLTP